MSVVAAEPAPVAPVAPSLQSIQVGKLTTTAAAPAAADVAFVPRSVAKVVPSRDHGEGDGARVRRSIGTVHLKNLDPFLMLDDFTVTKPAGFPDHPHRGFETVTFMFPFSKGTVMHEDFSGRAGTIGPVDVQWMTAGKGILHAEVGSLRVIAHYYELMQRVCVRGLPAAFIIPMSHLPS